MTTDEQLEKWVNGEAIHNVERDECCPDFSCCAGKIADKAARERFAKAHKEGDEPTKNEMLMMFLEQALAHHDPDAHKKVMIAGDKPKGHLQ